jgi:elongation factor G
MSKGPPLIEIAVGPRTESDRERLALALIELAAEDSSFGVSTDQESGQTIIAGMGELHLDNIVDALKRIYKVELDVGGPQVAYRETISRPVTKDHIYKKLSGGSGQYARIKTTATASALCHAGEQHSKCNSVTMLHALDR